MLLSKLSNRNTHVCTSSIRMISFFTLQCELFTSWNVSNNASLVSARTGEGGWSTKCGQAWARGGASQKSPNLSGHPLWMTPNCIILIVSQFFLESKVLCKLNDYSFKLAPSGFWINFCVDQFLQISQLFDKLTMVYLHKLLSYSSASENRSTQNFCRSAVSVLRRNNSVF